MHGYLFDFGQIASEDERYLDCLNVKLRVWSYSVKEIVHQFCFVACGCAPGVRTYVTAAACMCCSAPSHDAYVEHGLPWSSEYGNYIPNVIDAGDDGSALGEDGHDDAEQ